MADQYLDYLAGQDATLARQEDEIIALRGKLQAAREIYEAFLESRSTNIDPEEVRGILKEFNGPFPFGVSQEEARQGEESCGAGIYPIDGSSPVGLVHPVGACAGAAGEAPRTDVGASRDTEDGRDRASVHGLEPTISQSPPQPDLPTMPAAEDEAQPDPELIEWGKEQARETFGDALGKTRPLGEFIAELRAKSAAREAQPADEPDDGLEIPHFLRRVPA